MSKWTHINDEEAYSSALGQKLAKAINENSVEVLTKHLQEGYLNLSQKNINELVYKTANTALFQDKGEVVDFILKNVPAMYHKRFEKQILARRQVLKEEKQTLSKEELKQKEQEREQKVATQMPDNPKPTLEDLKQEYYLAAISIKNDVAERLLNNIVQTLIPKQKKLSDKSLIAVVQQIERPEFLRAHLKKLSTTPQAETIRLIDLLGSKLGALLTSGNPNIQKLN